jgi:hypothetical protein
MLQKVVATTRTPGCLHRWLADRETWGSEPGGDDVALSLPFTKLSLSLSI